MVENLRSDARLTYAFVMSREAPTTSIRLLDQLQRPIAEFAIEGEVKSAGYSTAPNARADFNNVSEAPASFDVAVFSAATAGLELAAKSVVERPTASARVLGQVAFVQVGEIAIVPLATVVSWLLDTDRLGQAAFITTLLGDAPEHSANAARRRFGLVQTRRP